MATQMSHLRLAPVQSGPTVLVYDSFTDANGTLLNAHTPDIAPVGSVWVLSVAGGWDIQSNQADRLGATGARYATIETGRADVIVSVVAKALVANAQSSIMLRFVDNNNYLLANLSNPTNNVRFIQKLLGVVTVPNTSGPVVLTDGVDYALEVIANGNSIKISVDGVQVLDITNNNFLAATKHGIYGERLNELFDAFQVTTL